MKKKKTIQQDNPLNKPSNNPPNLPDFAEYLASLSENATPQNLDELAILTASNTVLMPGVVASISLRNKKSIKIIKKAHKDNVWIGVLAEKSDEASLLAGVNFVQEKTTEIDFLNDDILNVNNDSEDKTAKLDKKFKNPDTEKLYKIGTVAQIIKIVELPDGDTGVIVKGQMRFLAKKFTQNNRRYEAL